MSTPTKFYLTKRSNGYYYIGYFSEGRKRWKSTRSSRKNDAFRTISHFKELLQKETTPVRLSDFVSDLLNHIEGNYRPGTAGIYKSVMGRFVVDIGGNALLSSISPKDIDAYKTKRGQNISPATANIDLRTLRAAFNVALRWKLIETNPCAGIQLVRVPETQPTFLKKENFQTLISLIRETWLREMVILAVLTGMRRGELTNLRWQDVDFERKLITIQSNPTFKTKQGKRRTIPLSDVAYHLLKSRFQASPGDYVFMLNGRKIYDNWVTHKFKYWVYEAKLPNDKLHFHSLRHTFASWLVQDGVSLYEVQKLLGHSNIAVTQVYSHLQPENLHSTVNRISLPMN